MDGDSPSVRIVERVSERTGVTPTEMDPLFEVVDPDALDAIFRTTAGDSSRPGATVRFEYGDYLVTVDGSGESGPPKVTVDADAVVE